MKVYPLHVGDYVLDNDEYQLKPEQELCAELARIGYARPTCPRLS